MTKLTKKAKALDGVIPTGTELTLVGILRSDTAGTRGYTPMNIGQELFLLEDGVSGIELELHDADLAHAVASELMDGEKLPLDWTPSTWTQEHGFMLQNVESQQSLMWFLLLFIMIVAVIAGKPALVAGILMSAFSRPTSCHSKPACAMVASVSCARSGETSIETRPSTPLVAS